MLNRREFVRLATVVGGLGYLRVSASASLRPVAESRLDRAAPAQATFQGTSAGQQRTVSGVEVCWCPPGRFLMGSPPNEAGRRPDESQVEVTLTRGLWIGKFEVTQGQWRRVVGEFPDRLPSAEFGEGDDYPAYWVSFLEAERFCSLLTGVAHRTGALPEGWVFRIPTEAQWEYACRAGTSTATAFGNEVRPEQINFGREPRSTSDGASLRASERVGSYRANPWGIHDMHGNVWEWCRDWYHARLPGGRDPDLYEVPGVQNGDGTYSRVRRGGAWIEPAWACRSACRLRYEPPRRSDHIGFRVAVVQL